MLAHDAIIEAQVNQTHHANKRRREEPEFEKGSYVYLSTKNLNLPKGRAKKLLPRYIGPYKVLQTWPKTSNCQLELPQELLNRRIHDKFHSSLLRPYRENNDKLFPGRDATRFYDFGHPDKDDWFITGVEGHVWENNKLRFLVKWSLGTMTWVNEKKLSGTDALSDYLALQGVSTTRELARAPVLPDS